MSNHNIAIIGDIHLGLKGDSPIYHKIHLDYANTLKEILLENKIEKCIQVGDVYNSRTEIGVDTLHVAEKFFTILKDFQWSIVVGNHDTFLANSNEINSLSIFNGWKNIKIYDKSEVEILHNKKVGFVPWVYAIDELPKCDVLFGHFEINTFKQSSMNICEKGVNSTDLLNKSSLVFSGHFHINQERTYPNGVINYVGSIFQMNFGEMNNDNGVYILNMEDLTYKFIKIQTTPKHYVIRLSELMENTNKLAEYKNKFKNNFVKFIVDKNLEYDKLNNITTSLNSLHPLTLNIDFQNDLFKINENVELNGVEINTEDAIKEFIKNINTELDKELVIKEILQIYNDCLERIG